MAQLHPTPLVFVCNDPTQSARERRASEQAAFDGLMATSNALRQGSLVGFIYRVPLADGFALYRVVRETPLVLQHVRHGDAHALSPAHIGRISREDVEHAAAARRRLVAAKALMAG